VTRVDLPPDDDDGGPYKEDFFMTLRDKLRLIESDLNSIHGLDNPMARSFRPSWEFQRHLVLDRILIEQLEHFGVTKAAWERRKRTPA
jgi:hypothetical protein